MQTYNNLYPKVYSYKNLYLAYRKARKSKAKKDYVIEFEKYLENNLVKLQKELKILTYKPELLKTFIIHDPKTRKICKSSFRDRLVHHALCNIIEPIFNKIFINDSYANRKNKGTSKALIRLQKFIRKITNNNSMNSFYLKCDIKHYFETVNQEILIRIIGKKIKDKKLIYLIALILRNYGSKLGMPLGNLTSQFFANVYLNELDYFIKYELKIKYYIRYVDDFVILHKSKTTLEHYKKEINNFLKNNLKIELHDGKSKIYHLHRGINFLGYRNFYHHKILRKNKRRLLKFRINLILKEIDDYQVFIRKLEATFAHLEIANTFNLRKNIVKSLAL